MIIITRSETKVLIRAQIELAEYMIKLLEEAIKMQGTKDIDIKFK